jgi:phosphoglycolate phosphatase
LLFDLDGTLVDTAPDLAAALNRLLGEDGRPPLDLASVTGMVGDGAAKLVERAFAATGAPAGDTLEDRVRRFLEIYGARVAVDSRPYEGVPEVLAALHDAGWRMAVCTNKPQRPSEDLLRAVGLAPYLQTILGGDRATAKKPDPRHLLQTLELLGATQEQAVMIGDNMNDVTAGRAAGLPVIAVSYGYTRGALSDLGATRLIERFRDLPGALEELAAGTAAVAPRTR